MKKTCHLLFLMCITFCCYAQKSDTYYGIVLTGINYYDTCADTSRLLYCRNVAGDRLSVYTFRGGIVAEAIAYQLKGVNDGLLLFSRSLLPGQVMVDSLSINFQDNTRTVLINNTDLYTLFSSFYARFKQQVKVNHAIMALLNLLSDGIGDYLIADVLPLLTYTPQLDQQIRQARIVTQRTQAEA